MTETILPLNYTILIEPDLEQFTFAGMVDIVLHSSTIIDVITLHAYELEFLHCTLHQNGIEQDCAFSLDPSRQDATIRLPVPVQGEFNICINYIGTISHQYVGLYRSKYRCNEKEKVLASTQFEAKEARRAFPCFDQPDKKATFDIEYVIPAGLTGISNNEVVAEQPLEEGKKRVRFARTPEMPTYLVVFGIGEFEFLEDRSKMPLMRVITTPGKTKYGQFALDIGRKSLYFGADYTGIPFPLSKCDFIAIPDSLGAMENFGAIRHCEDDLLVYPNTSKARAVLTAKIIAHETIHQWFGDLVSPTAWKHLWLNEAFATYFTYVIPHHFFPEWGVWEQFFHERLLTAMERDSLASTVPIDLPELDDLDADPSPTASTKPIIYNKGAAVLRMLAAYLGESRFKQAVHDFLFQYQFKSASSDQFWDAFSKSANLSLEEFARTWTCQPGYPLLEVEREGQILNLTQTRFTYDPQPAPVSTWVIPVEVLLFLEDSSTRTIKILLDQSGQSVQLPEDVTAYKLNPDFTGFYRVHYPRNDLEKLGELVGTQKLSAMDSLNVLNDFFALVKAGIYSVDEYLHFVEAYLISEDRYLPLVGLAANLSYLYRVVRAKRTEISSLGNAIFEKNLDLIGYLPAEDETLLVTELRSTLLSAALLMESKSVSEFGKVQFQALLNGESDHPDMYAAVLKIGVAVHPGAADWLRARAVDAGLPEGERVRALEALGNLYQAGALKQALALNMELVPSSLRHHLLMEASFNPSAFDWLWDWFAENLSQVEREIPPSYVQMVAARLVPYSGIGHREEVECCLREFSNRHPDAADSMLMVLELLAVNEALSRTIQ